MVVTSSACTEEAVAIFEDAGDTGDTGDTGDMGGFSLD